MFDIGGGELLFIVLLIVILFGPKKLPELMQGLGRGMREFKKAQREFTDHINTAFDDEQRRSYRRNQSDTHRSDANTIARNAQPAKSEYEAEMNSHDRDIMDDVDATAAPPPMDAPEGTAPRASAPASNSVSPSTGQADDGTNSPNDTNNQNI